MARDKLNISSINSDGTDPVQLTINAGDNYTPAATADGRHILFASDRNGPFNIWRMNADDGSDPVQLTFTDGNFYPSSSSDNKWVAFDNQTDTKMSVWKVPLQGGEPVKIADEAIECRCSRPTVNSWRAGYDEDSDTDDIAIFPARGGQAVEILQGSETGMAVGALARRESPR